MRRISLLASLVGLTVSLAVAQTPLVAPEGALAFPKDAAGISAWVKLDRTIRIDDALTKIFHRIKDVSGSHILGTVEISDFVQKTYPHVYINVQGWIVAFFLPSEPTASIIRWLGDVHNPQPRISTTLEAAIEKVAAALQFTLPKPTFYDFRYPKANNMLILLRVFPAADTKVMYLKFPSNYKIHHVSYYHYGCNLECPHVWQSFVSNLTLNGSLISKLSGDERFPPAYEVKDLPVDLLRVGVLHELELVYSQQGGDCGSAGLALVVIYQSP